MASKVSFSYQHQSLVEIAGIHDVARASLIYYHDPQNPGYSSVFAGLNNSEITGLLAAHLQELDVRSAFGVLASLEAVLRIDYLLRVYRRDKDPISREFRAAYALYGPNFRLEDGILEAWKTHYPPCRTLISSLFGAMNYRHWIAHGRYWLPKFGQQYDYYNVSALAIAVKAGLPLMAQ